MQFSEIELQALKCCHRFAKHKTTDFTYDLELNLAARNLRDANIIRQNSYNQYYITSFGLQLLEVYYAGIEFEWKLLY